MAARLAHVWELDEEHECDAAERDEFFGDEKPDAVTGTEAIPAHMQLASVMLSGCCYQLPCCAVKLSLLCCIAVSACRSELCSD